MAINTTDPTVSGLIKGNPHNNAFKQFIDNDIELQSQISTETTNRINGDNNLQSQFNGLVASGGEVTPFLAVYPVTTSGTSSAYTAITDGTTAIFGTQKFAITFHTPNTGACTFNLNSGGAVNIKIQNQDSSFRDPSAGELHDTLLCAYDAVNGYLVPLDAGAINATSNIFKKNYLINGDFQVWQRGTSFISPNYIYTADRYRIQNAADANILVERSSDTYNSEEYSFRIQQISINGVSGSFSDIVQCVENYKIFRNKYVTFSAWVKADVGVETYCLFEDGVNYCLSPNFIGNGNWMKLEVSGVVNSNTTYLNMVVRFIREGVPVGSGLNISMCKLELGDKSTPFVSKYFAEELRDCQRYYYKSYVGSTSNGNVSAYSISTNLLMSNIQFPTQMRVPPSVTIVNNNIINQLRRTTDNTVVSLVSPVINSNENGISFLYDNLNYPLVTNSAYDFDIIADAEIH